MPVWFHVHFLVLKTTGSAFTNFIRDEYTTLVEVDDRILSTAVDLSYTFAPITIPAPTDDAKLELKLTPGVWDDSVYERARKITLEVFAKDDSASVQACLMFHDISIFYLHRRQATLYKMAQQLIAETALINSVTYTLPNKHYVPVDMKYIGIDNMTPWVSSSLSLEFLPDIYPFAGPKQRCSCRSQLRGMFLSCQIPYANINE